MSSDDIIKIALHGTDGERSMVEEDYGMEMLDVLDDMCCQATAKGHIDLAKRIGEAHETLAQGGE